MVSSPRALVVGLAETGLAAGRLLVKKGYRVSFSEQRAEGEMKPEDLRQARTFAEACFFGGHQLDEFLRQDLIVLSPGVPATLPILEECRCRGLNPIGEVELAGRYLRGRLITVTGTKGKTSTMHLLEALLSRAQDIDFELGGHICKPLSACDPERPLVLAELACYQMEGLETLIPDIHLVTNVFPDHQDRYPQFQDYFRLKTGLCLKQGPGQIAILPETLRSWAMQAGVTAELLTFSRRDEVESGCWFDSSDSIIHVRRGSQTQSYSTRKVGLIGHQDNLMAAILVGSVLGIDESLIQETLDCLKPLRHRGEILYADSCVRIIDDAACNNGEAINYMLNQLSGPVQLITLNMTAPLPDAVTEVKVIRLEKEALADKLASIVSDNLARLFKQGGTLLFAPGIPVPPGDPQLYLNRFSTVVAEFLSDDLSARDSGRKVF